MRLHSDLMESDPVRDSDLESGQSTGQHGLRTEGEDACGCDALALERERRVQENRVSTPLWKRK